MTKSTPVIQVDHATKRFGDFAAADDVSFSVKAGEIVGFVGENGAGKTTTINMLLGFTSPTRGNIELFGKPVRPSTAHKSHRKIGYASGDMALPEQMTGEQYIRFVLDQSAGDHAKRYDELVAAFKPQLGKKIATLSRGNRQKIALVAAFVTEPELVIFDEPTSGLDPVMQDVFLDAVRDMSARGATVLMSSHYLQEVAEVCTRVLLMKRGRIMENLSAEQLASRGGKVVAVLTKKAVVPPKQNVVDLTNKQDENGHETSFGFTGDPSQLAKWIGGLSGVIDISVTDRTLEQEFRNVYGSEEAANE